MMKVGSSALSILNLPSRDVFTNLATERALFRTLSKEKLPCHLFLTYIDTPSVVIGRFQNYWHEVNINEVNKSGLKVARRETGGGAVYHDEGNLNVSIFSNTDSIDPALNFSFVIDVLKHHFPSLKLRGFSKTGIFTCARPEYVQKVGGSALRRGTNVSYHHFTILSNSNLNKQKLNLESALKKLNVKSFRATISNDTKTGNLNEIISDSNLSPERIIEMIQEYHKPLEKNQQYFNNIYSGLDEEIKRIRDEIEEREWVIDQSPPMTYLGSKNKFELELFSNQYKLSGLKEEKQIPIDTQGELTNENFNTVVSLLDTK
ncbi:MAG: Lipoyltransferase 1, mitochondrial [Paramarteilia canceri]